MVSDDSERGGQVAQVRSPADVLRLIVAGVVLIVLLLVQWLFGEALVSFASELLEGFSAWPQWIVDTLAVGTRLLAVAVLLVGVVATVVRHGARVVLTVAVGAALAAVLVPLLDRLDAAPDGAQVTSVSVPLGPLSSSDAPTIVGIGMFAAALTAGAPWLRRRWRRLGWLAVAGLVWTRFITSPVSFDSIQADVVGWVCGAAALVLLGAPSRRPTAASIERGLATAGLPLSALKPASVDARGSTPYFGTAANGDRYFVKALGADQRSADLLFRMYRSVWRNELGDERPFSSLRRGVEHEAFLALAARDLGVRTPRFRALAAVEPNSFVLAYDLVEGRSLDGVSPEDFTDGVLRAAWDHIAFLRAHRIAHRDLRLANLFLGADGQVWMIDFGFSELAASDLLLATDVAELLASSSLVVGPERAIAPVLATVDEATRAAAAERLHPRLLSGATRTGAEGPTGAARRPPPAARATMRWEWLTVAGSGALVLAGSVWGARHDVIPAWEQRVFRAVNRLPGWLYRLLWLPMQLGNLVVGTAVGLAVALWQRHVAVAIGVVAAMFLKLVTERVVRRRMAAYLEVRQRPGTSEPGAVLRGDVPATGASFPSGHVILVAAIACLVTPILPLPWSLLPFVLTFLVMLGRVYVGAHNPLDTTAGLGAGLLLGGLLSAFF